MRGEAEVVVAAEVDAARPVELDLGGVVREAPDRAAPAAEALLVEVREHRLEGAIGAAGTGSAPGAAAGSGRMPSRLKSA